MASQDFLNLAQQKLVQQSPNPFLTAAEHRVSTMGGAPEGERTFLENISESFKRGQENVLADVAVYEALHTPGEDVTGTLLARKKLQSKAALDPLEGRYLTQLTYKAANTAGQVLESAKRAAVGSIVGAAVGGISAGVASAVFPTVGEEPVAIGAGVVGGATLGAKVGGHGFGGTFMYKQGVGSMYADMLEQGIDPAVASVAAHVGGLPYAAVEMAQFKLLGAPAKRIITGKAKALIQANALKAITKGVSTYAKTFAGEWTEEMLQEMIQVATEKGAEAYQEGGLTIDKEYVDETVQRMYDVGKGAAEAFALLPVPGAMFESGVSYASAQLDSQLQKTMQSVDDVTRVAPKDVSDPQAQLFLAMRDGLREATESSDKDEKDSYARHVQRARVAGNEPMAESDYSTKFLSNKLFRQQEQARAAERSERLGKKAGDVRDTSNFANYTKNLRQALHGDEYTKLGIQPLESKLPLETFNTLRQEILASNKLQPLEAFNLMEALQNVYWQGGTFKPSDWKIAKKVWSPNVVNMMQAISNISNITELHPLVGINDFMRATASSMDLSGLLRQNKFTVGKPTLFARMAAVSGKVLAGGTKTAHIINNDLISSDRGQAAIRYGVRVEDFGPGVSFETGSEAFPSAIAGRVPGLARTQAAYTVGGNFARVNMFGEIWEAKRGTASEKELQDLAKIVNILGGIGDAKLLGKYAHTLNSIFFAPRNFFANVQVWTELLNPATSLMARKYLAWNMVKWASINAGVLAGLSAVPGVKVDRDPRSTDFGKIVVGNTHIDFWGGQLPLFRTVYRLLSGERKTASGAVVSASAKDTIIRFFQSKLGPLPAAALDMWKGETFWGEERSISDVDDITAEIWEKLTPFFIQDVVDAVRYEGAKGLAFAPLSFMGASAQSYPMTKSTEVSLRKNELSLEVFHAKWDELGPDGQKYMRAKFPEITLMEREATYERERGYFMDTIEKNIKASQKRVWSALPKDAQQEFEALKLNVSGVSKRVATNWYLNDKRYQEYEKLVMDSYKVVLPRLMRSAMWQRMNPLGRAEAIKRVTEELKEGARRTIIMKAKRDDLQRIRYGGGK